MNLNQIYFCAEECRRQKSGELSVARMCQAWRHAFETWESFIEDNDWEEFIKELAYIVDPGNYCGYRKVPVSFSNRNVVGWENISRQMEMFCENIDSLSPQEAYEAFEKIHPFKDGNGRLGKIIFNILNGSMEDPRFPNEPNF